MTTTRAAWEVARGDRYLDALFEVHRAVVAEFGGHPLAEEVMGIIQRAVGETTAQEDAL